VHPSMPAAPGCWAVFAGLSDWLSVVGGADPTTAQQAVDAYAVQHGTDPGRRGRQSVAVHLMSLAAGLERAVPGERLRTLLGHWTHRDYPRLLPVPTGYDLTVLDVAPTPVEGRVDAVAAWAAASWAAWRAHHATVRAWLDERLG